MQNRSFRCLLVALVRVRLKNVCDIFRLPVSPRPNRGNPQSESPPPPPPRELALLWLISAPYPPVQYFSYRSPTHNDLKFSAVRGTISLRSSKVSLVADPPIETSKYTARVRRGSKCGLDCCCVSAADRMYYATFRTAPLNRKRAGSLPSAPITCSSLHLFVPMKRSSPGKTLHEPPFETVVLGNRRVQSLRSSCPPSLSKALEGNRARGNISVFMETPRVNSGRPGGGALPNVRGNSNAIKMAGLHLSPNAPAFWSDKRFASNSNLLMLSLKLLYPPPESLG